MSHETKAGLLTLLGLALLGAFIVVLRGGVVFRERGYDLHVRVLNAGGITVGAPVQMAGVEIGRVRRLGLTAERLAEITIGIRPGIAIPQGSRFAIATAGVLGDRFITISPGPPQAPALAPGAVVSGTDPFTLEELFARVAAVAHRAEEALGTVNRLLGDPALAAGLRETVQNTREASAVIRRAAEHVDRATRALGGTVETQIPEIARQLRLTAEELARAATQIHALTRDVAHDGQTARQIREGVASLQRASRGVEKMVDDLAGVINEQEVSAVRASLAQARHAIAQGTQAITQGAQAITEGRQAIGEARGVLARADRVVERVSRIVPERLEIPDIRTTYRLEYALWYDGRRFGHDVTFSLLPDAARTYLFTWRDIGDAGRIGLQIGQRLNPQVLFRYGLIDSHLGVGLDYRASPSTAYGLDLYNLNQITLNLSARYFLHQDYGIALRAQSLLFQPGYGLGVFWRF